MLYEVSPCAKLEPPQRELIGIGATGAVYQLNAFIAVKKARSGEDEETDHANEQAIFAFLETRPPIPYSIRCLYRTPKNTFLELVPNGSLAMLLNKYQQRGHPNFYQVLKVTQSIDLQDIYRWMTQLCIAAAGLERNGLCHGDIRPGNLLLDTDCNLKLCDFDRVTKVGEDIVVAGSPFARLLNKEDGPDAGSYGKSGARTETFAIGSIFYTLLRGHEPYETESWGSEHGPILIKKFQRREFPLLTNSTEDAIIHKCWNEKYHSVSHLLADVAGSDKQDEPGSEDQEWLKLRQLECKEFIQSGLVDSLNAY